MKDGPNITKIAALIGDRARAEMLTALMSGMALTATELAAIANVTKQTVSAHLSKLVEARLLAVDAQGRHRYFRLADEDVAQLLELLMGVAFRTGALRLRASPREPALRKARVCYDHLAGELGVMLYDSLAQRGAFTLNADGVSLTNTGRDLIRTLGVEPAQLEGRRRSPCRTCMDWSERRHHLAGTVAQALLARFLALGWARRVNGSRIVAFTSSGEENLRVWCATRAQVAKEPAGQKRISCQTVSDT